MKEKEVRELPVTLTDAELAVKSQTLARRIRDLKAVQEAKKEANANFKAKENTLDSQISALAIQVREGKETRAVEVYEDLIFERSIVNVIRADTDEVVETRPMSAADRQGSLLSSNASK